MIEAVQNQSGLHAAILLCQHTGWIMRCPAADFLFTVVVMPIHVSLRWVHRDLIGPSLPETRHSASAAFTSRAYTSFPADSHPRSVSVCLSRQSLLELLHFTGGRSLFCRRCHCHFSFHVGSFVCFSALLIFV